jgi:hypothetical protein
MVMGLQKSSMMEHDVGFNGHPANEYSGNEIAKLRNGLAAMS